MTTADLVALVAGVALGFAALAKLPGLTFLPNAWLLAIIVIHNLFLAVAIASAVVALGRALSYRRMPRAAEWLAILVSASGVASWPEFNVDGWVNFAFATFPGSVDRMGFDGWRWAVAGFVGLAMIAGLGVIHLGRRSLPIWLKTLLLWGLSVLALAGPLWAWGFLGDDLVSPSGGFGAGDLAILHREACILFGHFPTGVFFGVPAIAAVLERLTGRRWSWVEWAGVASSTMVGLMLLVTCRGEFDRPSLPWMLERGLALAWTLAVVLTSRLIVARLGPSWRRWVEGSTPPTPDRGWIAAPSRRSGPSRPAPR